MHYVSLQEWSNIQDFFFFFLDVCVVSAENFDLQKIVFPFLLASVEFFLLKKMKYFS